MAVALDEDSYEQPTSYEYDAAGKQTAVIDPLGHTISYTEQNGWHVIDTVIKNGTHRTQTQYDGNRRKAVIDALGNQTEFEYDSIGRVVKTIYPSAPPDNNYPTYVHTSYDPFGRKAWQSDQITQPDANLVDPCEIRWFEYDSGGRLTKVWLPPVIDPCTSQWTTEPCYEYEYDDYGNMVLQRDPKGRETKFTYDHLHNLTVRQLPNGATEYREYDDLGRLIKTTDFKGQVTGYFYNDRGQLWYKKYYNSSVDYPASPAEIVEYIYDKLGRKDIVYKDSQPVEQYSYDAEGRALSITTPEGTVNYSYNSITGQKARTYTSDTDIDYDYDGLGRLETAHLIERNGQAVAEQSDYTYNKVGSRRSLSYANGNYTFYVYDALNRLTSLTNFEQFESNPQSPAGNTLSKFEYELYADGMRKSVTEEILLQGGTPGVTPLTSQVVNYTYDNLNRLTVEHAVDGVSGYTAEYEYDLVGNRISRSVWFDHRADELYTEYEHNEHDRLIRETHKDTIPSAMIEHSDGPYYAYAGSGGIFYGRDSSKTRIGQFNAWLIGLPSPISHWLFGLIMVMLVVAFFVPALIQILARIRGRQPARMPLSLRHRCLSVLLAYVMLISPAGFEQLAQASLVYSDISPDD
jgi:YD repeat-containing protein